MESLQWRRRPEIADFCPLSWSNVSWIFQASLRFRFLTPFSTIFWVFWGPERIFPRICLPKILAKFGWTFCCEFLLKPSFLCVEGPNCWENSWEVFGWFFAIERLFRSPSFWGAGADRPREPLLRPFLDFGLKDPNDPRKRSTISQLYRGGRNDSSINSQKYHSRNGLITVL